MGNKRHVFLISYAFANGSGSGYRFQDNKNITKPDIDSFLEYTKRDTGKKCAAVAVSYLGHMTEKEFYGEE